MSSTQEIRELLARAGLTQNQARKMAQHRADIRPTVVLRRDRAKPAST